VGPTAQGTLGLGHPSCGVYYRQRNSGYKTEHVKYHGTRPVQFPTPVPSFSPYTHLSLKKREVAQHLHTHNRLAWWCRTALHLSHPWGRALGQPMRQVSALVLERGTCHLVKRKKAIHGKRERYMACMCTYVCVCIADGRHIVTVYMSNAVEPLSLSCQQC